MVDLICSTTRHPCGSDTWNAHWICPCRNCQEWIGNEHKRLNEENAKLKADLAKLQIENTRSWVEIKNLRESMELSAKSYDANMLGWQEENAKLKVELEAIKGLERKRKICGLVNIEDYEELATELERVKSENSEMINAAGEALGIDTSLRGPSCVAALVNNFAWRREEINRLRKEAKNV